MLIVILICSVILDWVKPSTPELNPFTQRCLTRIFNGDFASLTVHFVNICVKNQKMQQLFIQFVNYVWYFLHVSAIGITLPFSGSVPCAF
jgi:ABC-type uncharacterized transport system permease subunit